MCKFLASHFLTRSLTKSTLVCVALFLSSTALADPPVPKNNYKSSQDRLLYFPTSSPTKVIWKVSLGGKSYCPHWFTYKITGDDTAGYKIAFTGTGSGSAGHSMSGTISKDASSVTVNSSNFSCKSPSVSVPGIYKK